MHPLQEDLRLVEDAALRDPSSMDWTWLLLLLVAAAAVYLAWRLRARQAPDAEGTVPVDWTDELRRARRVARTAGPVQGLDLAARVLRLALGQKLGEDFSSLTTSELAARLATMPTEALAHRALREFFVPVDSLRFSAVPLDLPTTERLIDQAETLLPAFSHAPQEPKEDAS